MIVKLFSTLTAAALAITLGAIPSRASLDSGHSQLIQALRNQGVRVYINPAQCEEFSYIHGFYISQASVLAICQDNATKVGQEGVEWTDNDLDTLRHESHHLVQDCVGQRGDNVLDLFFSDNLVSFIQNSSLSEEQKHRIISNYMRQTGDIKTVELELEAFAVAADVEASTIATAIDKVCSKW